MIRSALLAVLFAAPTAATAAQESFPTPPLPDEALAVVVGKFLLPNGTTVAMSVTSDTLVDGQLLLRSVLTIDTAAKLQVYTAREGAQVMTVTRSNAASPMVQSGITVLFDRQSGMRTVTPTFTVSPTVAVGVSGVARVDADLMPVALVAGGPAVDTPGGRVSLADTGNRVMLAGDRIDVTHVVGPAIATAVANTANNRTIDTVTSIDIDLPRVTAFAVNSASLRASDLALDATRAMVR